MSATTDILIAGAGPSGLIAAAALAKTGQRITVVDPQAPEADSTKPTKDQRSTAFLQPAIALFQQIGVWDGLAAHGHPLHALRIVDLTGEPPEIRGERQFNSAEMGDQPFGWNFMNWQLRGELIAHLDAQANVDLCFGRGVRGLLVRTGVARVALTDGSHINCKLAVAADGHSSALRTAAGIGVKTTRYGQKSLAFVATHAVPHHGISTELYHLGGPFTMVPLADIGGRAASAIVWMNTGPRAMALLGLDAVAFSVAMMGRTGGLFGEMALVGGRNIFPVITQRARQLVDERGAVIAEAAHVFPPIGAQGLNTSVMDIIALCEAINTGGRDPGAPPVLARFARARGRDVALRAGAIDLFNRITRSGLPPVQSLRLAGLKAAHDIAPLRRGLMRAGMEPL